MTVIVPPGSPAARAAAAGRRHHNVRSIRDQGISAARFGVSLGYWQDRDPLESVETALLADALGYRELWLGEMATFDAFALAAAVAARTTTIPLTIGPLAVGVRDPVTIAMGVASVAALTGRHVNVAVGSSSPTVVSRWHGRDIANGPARLRESVHALRSLLAGDRTSVLGTAVRTDGYRLRLAPPGSSITVAAFGPAAVATAAELGDRMVLNLCTVDAVARLRADLHDAAARSDRPAPPVAVWIPVAVDPDDATLDQLRRALVAYVAAPGYGEMFADAGFGDVVTLARGGARPADVLDAIPVALVEAIGAVGDQTACRARLEAYARAGADDLALVPATAGDPAGRRTLTALAPG
ncbi:MAG: LLM class F420-dependent oxidoreductase [Acidimicrobiia bacterium]